MFSGLVGFIKPLLSKNRTETKQIAKVRSIDKEDAPQNNPFDDIEDQVSIGEDTSQDANKGAPFDTDDEMRISIDGLIHLVKDSDESDTDKAELIEILDRLKKKGVETLPFDTTSPLINQIKAIEE